MNHERAAGPLDVARAINSEATELDTLIRDKLGDKTMELWNDVKAVASGLSERHPLTGEDVIVYGLPVTFSVGGDDEPRPLAITANHEYRAVTGSYRGIVMLEVHDPKAEVAQFRLLHQIYTGSSALVSDAFYNMDQKHFYDYVLVHGSEVVAVDPVNAHSLIDLERDRITAQVDEIVLDETKDPAKRVNEVGLLLNEVLGSEEENELSQQRVSYLNSLGLLKEVVILTDDLVLGDKKAFESSPHLLFSEGSTDFEIYPERFQVALGYTRFADGSILPGGAPELYVEGELKDGQLVFAPMKSAIEVERD